MRESVQKAIEEITYKSKKFPEEPFRIISENKELAVPYLCEAIEKALDEKDDLDENYQLHFYAIHLLGQFQAKECFPLLVQFVSLPEDTLDYMIGDAITSTVHNILYNTYNGELKILKKAIRNLDISEYVRGGMLQVMGQLYLDGDLEKGEWQDFIRQIVYAEDEIGSYIYEELAHVICGCHMVEMLPEIKRLCEDYRAEGQYALYVDRMFSGRKNFCKAPVNAADMLRGWAMFEESPETFGEKDIKKLIRAVDLEYGRQTPKVKIGRNDPCPCGSGKKYKKCCLNKPKSSVELIESEQEKKKWLRSYPISAKEREEGRVYLEDFFDSDSIEIDKLIYLALNERPCPIWLRESEEVENKRKKVYLSEAFSKFAEKIKKDNIRTFQEYDEKYSIHFPCEEWIESLQMLLDESEERELSETVSECCMKMRV